VTRLQPGFVTSLPVIRSRHGDVVGDVVGWGEGGLDSAPARPALPQPMSHPPASRQPQHLTVPDSMAGGGEDELLRRLRRGDDEAYERLVRDLTPRLLSVARRIVRSMADAEDAVQEGFVSAFRGIETFDGRSTLATWIHRIVVNAALARLRSKTGRGEVSVEALMPQFESGLHTVRPTPWRQVNADDARRAEEREALDVAIARLPVDFRTVIVLKDIEGHGSDEVAEMLGISAALVRQRLHRGRMALMKLLEPTLKEERP
jgi:RNA polymerase sigma-70 factor, ECF subfamily